MSARHVTPPDARLAASLLLFRDGPAGMEVLMLTRAERGSDPRSGAAVFPGGVLDKRDRAAHVYCDGLDDATASARLGLPEHGMDYWVAAVRETFEEVGLLLASTPVDLAHLEHWREKLHDNTASMADFCTAERLRIDLRGLAYYSHWLTPPGSPKRFDTRFFAALAPAGQEAKPDLGEAVELMWITPKEAMGRERGLKLMPVTRRTLMDLARFPNAAAAMEEIRARSEIPMIMPRRVMTSKGSHVVLPHEWAYAEVGKLDPEGRLQTIWSEITPGRAVQLSPRIWRVTAPNPGAMTGPGTNTYLVGDVAANAELTVVDPGPESAEHLQAILAAAAQAAGRIVRILATHTHHDHSPGAVALAAATGAPVFGRKATFAERQDTSFAPEREPSNGERFELAPGTTLRVIHTPGHASNHLCYLLEEEKLLFTGDHVMQGSTVVINPPDGDMVAYFKALHALLDEDIEWFAPGHGFLVAQPHDVVRGLIAHRLRREAKVLNAVQAAGAPATVDALVPTVYDDVAPAMHGMAQRSLLAHLLKLQADGAVKTDGARWSVA